jgi:hypothetical protein
MAMMPAIDANSHHRRSSVFGLLMAPMVVRGLRGSLEIGPAWAVCARALIKYGTGAVVARWLASFFW